jgi:hypothetical protein
MIDAYQLTEIEQGTIFCLAAFVSMCYHYLDHYLTTKKRLLDDVESLWTAINIYGTMMIGSTIWAYNYPKSNTEMILAGLGLGAAAFSRGLSELGKK